MSRLESMVLTALALTLVAVMPGNAAAQSAAPPAGSAALLGTPSGSAFTNLQMGAPRGTASTGERALLGASSGPRIPLDAEPARAPQARGGEAALLGRR
jgi:hypothetical protein